MFPFIITLIASFSTLIGYFVIFFNKKDEVIISSLSFSAGIMLSISLLDLIPESYVLLNNISLFPLIIIILLDINMGFIISMYINKRIQNNNNFLYRVGLLSMIIIIIHNIPEGMITFIAGNTNKELGIKLMITIAMHNIPEGISIAVPIYYSTNSKLKSFIYTLISGFSEFIGSIIIYVFFKPFINNYLLGNLFSIIAGIMMYISIYELLPLSLSYNNKKYTYNFLFLGIILIILSKFVIG